MLFDCLELIYSSEPPSNITAYNTSSSSIHVMWDRNYPDYHGNHNVSGYKLTYREHDLNNEENNLLCSLDFTADLTNLTVFTSYCIELASFTNNNVSNRSQCLLVTTDEEPPNSLPQNFTAFNISSTSIRITWDPVPLENRRGIILGYKIFFDKLSRSRRAARSVDNGEQQIEKTDILSYDFVGLDKFTSYCVWAVAFNSKGDSNETNEICISTDEDVPSHPPLDISAHNTSSTSVYVKWVAIPTHFIHGILLGYKVFYGKTSEPSSQYSFVTLTDQLDDVNLSSLEKFTVYCIQLTGFTRIGDGNKSECFNVKTDEDVPSGAPHPVAEKFFSPTAINVTWEVLPASVSHGTVIGYKIHVKQTASATQSPEVPLQEFTWMVDASKNSFTLGNLSLFTKYQVQMAASTSKGFGNFSNPIFAETCRCQKYFSTSISLSSLDKGGPGGITDVIANSIKKSCGFCQEHGETELIFSKVDDGESNLKFAVAVTNPRGSDFSKFVAVLEVPGVVVIKRRDKSAQHYYDDQVITGSLLDAWPIIAVSLLTIYSAGVIIWFLAAAIANSSEAKLATVGPLSNKLKLTTTYSTLERLAQSLKDGEVDYVLVDMYVPVKRTDLFNGSWFEVVALIKVDMFIGVILQGDAMKLASALEELVANDNVQTKFLTDNEKEEETPEVESKASLFFDPSSPFFQQFLYASLGVLCLFLVCGVLYQVVYVKQSKRKHLEYYVAGVYKTEREKIKMELESLVEEFYHSLRQIMQY
ncbi:hypothetical protein OS493_030876 [Desmophyllum pertusum]|uniref:Fibronectin type-III domain-containing protein n=1 Tax=Desmophyllum pertusum TaxID=174260 RepID=A0A9W9Y8L1_9CNID|nr:hypothetical protein OS493_030876 [Desmophyllum pertusum]